MPTLRTGSAAAGTGSAASTTVSFTVPSGTVAGDIIGIWVMCNSNTRTFSATGYTYQAASNSGGASASAGLLYKTAAAGDLGGNVTVTVSGAALAFAGVIFSVLASAGFDPATPDGGAVSTASTSVAGSSVTTTDNGDLLVWCGGARAGSAGGAPATITPPATSISVSTVVSQLSTTSASVANIGVLMGTGTQTSAGTISSEAGSLSVSQANCGANITFGDTAAGPANPGGLIMLFF